MKKRNEWVRKAIKREKKTKDRGIVDFAMIQNHFFKELPEWVNQMEDPRNPSYTIYTQADFFYMGILKNSCPEFPQKSGSTLTGGSTATP